jgi:hypothetical protein
VGVANFRWIWRTNPWDRTQSTSNPALGTDGLPWGSSTNALGVNDGLSFLDGDVQNWGWLVYTIDGSIPAVGTHFTRPNAGTLTIININPATRNTFIAHGTDGANITAGTGWAGNWANNYIHQNTGGNAGAMSPPAGLGASATLLNNVLGAFNASTNPNGFRHSTGNPSLVSYAISMQNITTATSLYTNGARSNRTSVLINGTESENTQARNAWGGLSDPNRAGLNPVRALLDAIPNPMVYTNAAYTAINTALNSAVLASLIATGSTNERARATEYRNRILERREDFYKEEINAVNRFIRAADMVDFYEDSMASAETIAIQIVRAQGIYDALLERTKTLIADTSVTRMAQARGAVERLAGIN